jgi:hypothetical protein
MMNAYYQDPVCEMFQILNEELNIQNVLDVTTESEKTLLNQFAEEHKFVGLHFQGLSQF